MERAKTELLGLVVETEPDKPVVVYRLVRVVVFGQQTEVPRLLPKLHRWKPILERIAEKVKGLPDVKLVIPRIDLPGIRVIVAPAFDSQLHEEVKESFVANGLPIGRIFFAELLPSSWPKQEERVS